MPKRAGLKPAGHWEIKGRFRKRVVLANVPSFRFSFRGNIRRNHPFGNHPFVNTKKGHWEIKGWFPKGWFWRTYPRSGFRSGGTSAKTTLLETALSRTPEQESGRKAPLSCNAAFSMLQCSFSFVAAQLLVQMTSALQKSRCCSAVSAAQHSENCSATSVLACGVLQGWV